MARKTKEAPQRVTSLKALKARLNKRFGEGTALTGTEVQNAVVKFFSTGSFALDVSLRGGIPYNRIVEIIGSESSCKTSLCHLMATEFIRDNPTGIVVHADLENSLDFRWMRRLGCNLTEATGRFVFAYADSGEQAGDIIDEVLADAGVPILVIVDSIMAMVPFAEMDSPNDQQFVGRQPQLINRIIRVANSRLKKAKIGQCSPTTLVLVNQTRVEIGATQYQFTPGFSSGGQGRKFFTSQRIVFSATAANKEEHGDGKQKHTIRHGKRVHYQIIKNKCGGPEETGHFIFHNKPRKNIQVGVDNGMAVVENGLLYEVLRRKGNFVKFGNTTLGNCVDKAAATIRADAKLAKTIGDLTMQQAREEFYGAEIPTASTSKKRSTGTKVRFAPKGKKTTR